MLINKIKMKRNQKEARDIILAQLYVIFQKPYTTEEKNVIYQKFVNENPEFAAIVNELQEATEMFNVAWDRLEKATEIFRGIGLDRPELATTIAEKVEPIDYDEDEVSKICRHISDREAYALGITPIDWVRVERNVIHHLQAVAGDTDEISEQDIVNVISRVTNILSNVISDAEKKVAENQPSNAQATPPVPVDK